MAQEGSDNPFQALTCLNSKGEGLLQWERAKRTKSDAWKLLRNREPMPRTGKGWQQLPAKKSAWKREGVCRAAPMRHTEHSDGGLEVRNAVVDIEAKVPRHPLNATLKLVVQIHQPQPGCDRRCRLGGSSRTQRLFIC